MYLQHSKFTKSQDLTSSFKGTDNFANEVKDQNWDICCSQKTCMI